MQRSIAVFCFLLVVSACSAQQLGPCSICYLPGGLRGPCQPNFPTRVFFNSLDCTGTTKSCFQLETYNECTLGDGTSRFGTVDPNSASGLWLEYANKNCSGDPFRRISSTYGICSPGSFSDSFVDLVDLSYSWTKPYPEPLDKRFPVTGKCMFEVHCKNYPIVSLSFKDANCKVFQSGSPLVEEQSNTPGVCLWDSSLGENVVYTCDGEYLTESRYHNGCHKYIPESIIYTKAGVCIPWVSGSSKYIKCANNSTKPFVKF